MRTDRGTTLLLFPVAVLVMMVLGAIAVDLGEVQLAHRQLIRAVGTAADDAADQLNVAGVRHSASGAGDDRLGDLDGDAARRTALADLAGDDLPGRQVGTPTVTIGPEVGTVTVEVTRDIPYIFAKAIPGAPKSQQVTVRLSGRLREPPP